MNEFQSALAAATACLRDSGLPFAVVGGVAVSARTVPRFTQDVDYSVAVGSDAAAQALGLHLFSCGFEQHSVLENTRTGRMATLRLRHDAIIVDLLLDASGIEAEIAAGATLVDLPGVGPCPVASISALLATKALARANRDRPEDEADLRRLASAASQSQWADALRLVGLIGQRGYGEGDVLLGILAQLRTS